LYNLRKITKGSGGRERRKVFSRKDSSETSIDNEFDIGEELVRYSSYVVKSDKNLKKLPKMPKKNFMLVNAEKFL
jgi:hypothetical protein